MFKIQMYMEKETKGKEMKPEECVYNDGEFCKKGLPGTKCELVGCAAFYPKSEKMRFYHELQMREMEKHLD